MVSGHERRESEGEGGEGDGGGGGEGEGGGGGGSQGGGATTGGGGCVPSSRGEETLLAPSARPNSMTASAEPGRDGADSRTDGPTKASEQIRARTSMKTSSDRGVPFGAMGRVAAADTCRGESPQ